MSAENQVIDIPEIEQRQAVRDYHRGVDPNQICSRLKVNRFVLNNWITHFSQKPEPFKAPAFSLEQQEKLRDALKSVDEKPEEAPKEAAVETPVPPTTKKKRKRKMGARIDDATKKEIAKRYAKGETAINLAEEYGVAANSVWRWSSELGYKKHLDDGAPVKPSNKDIELPDPEVSFAFKGDYLHIQIPKKLVTKTLLAGLI